MAKIKQGPNGPVSGKVGNLVYSSWHGISYVKKAPVRRARPTKNEQSNWNLFAWTQNWLQPLQPFFKVGFKNYKPTVHGINAAKSYLYKHALTKDGENSSIDPALMQVSYGSLGLAENIQMELLPGNELRFTWDPASGKDKAPNDQVMLLAYNVEAGKAAMIVEGQFRKTGSDSLYLAHHKKGTFHIYVSFVASDRSRQSHSIYLGSISTAD